MIPEYSLDYKIPEIAYELADEYICEITLCRQLKNDKEIILPILKEHKKYAELIIALIREHGIKVSYKNGQIYMEE